MKNILLILAGFLFLSLGYTFAKPERLEVIVNPSFKVNEYVDLTIKAIGSNGQVDTTYTRQDITIDIEDDQGKPIASADVVLPSNWFWYFEDSDLGVKIYSKWLALKKPGNYKVVVADIFDTTIKGSTWFTVIGDGTTPDMWTITVTSPTANSTQQSSDITIIGKTTNPNTPLSILIDDNKIKDGISDAQGNFSISASWLQPGDHKLVVNGLDLWNTVIASSWPIPFKIGSQDTTEITAKLSITPSTSIVVNNVLKYTITTKETASSVNIIIGSSSPQSTNKVSPWVFEKEIQMTTIWTFPISVEVIAWANKKFPNLETVTVQDEQRKILSLNGSLESDPTKVNLTWTFTGTINFFKLQYGTDRSDMKFSTTTTKPELQITLIDPKLTYYAQVFPVDQIGTVIWDPSQIIEIKQKSLCGNAIIESNEECDDWNILDGDSCSATCRITYNAPTLSCGNGVLENDETCDDGNTIAWDGCFACKKETCNPPTWIILKTKKVADKYYLYWGAVPWAVKYQIYRKDTQPSNNKAINELSLVAETTDTMFEYPFDPQASADQYARYAIQAVCSDGNTQILDSIKKVKVGPRETLMVLLVVISVLMYGFMRSKS